MTDLPARVAALAAEAKQQTKADRAATRTKLQATDPMLLSLLDELREKMGNGIKLTKLKLKSNE